MGENQKYFAGGYTSSAVDLARLVSILCNDEKYGDKQILSYESVALMESVAFHYPGDSLDFDQCLPLRYHENIYGREGLYFHKGSAYGVLSLMIYDPNSGSGVVVMTTGASSTKDEYDI